MAKGGSFSSGNKRNSLLNYKDCFNLGANFFHRGNYKSALKFFNKAIELKSDYVEAWNSKGLALYKLGRYDEALKAFDKAIELKFDYAEAWYNKGVILNKLGQYVKESFLKLWKDPQIIQIWYNSGWRDPKEILSRAKEIREFCLDRDIKEVVHFTHKANLENILTYGLLSRDELNRRNIKYKITDFYRIDEMMDGICLSISFPNYKYLYSLRMRSKAYYWNLVVISLKSEILWELPCLFFDTNAANERFREFRSVERRKKLMGVEALKRLFAEKVLYRDGSVKDRDPKLPKNYTTDPQAEVICLYSIPIDYIQKIYHHKRDKKIYNFVPQKWHHLLEANEEVFSPREDYKNWQAPLVSLDDLLKTLT